MLQKLLGAVTSQVIGAGIHKEGGEKIKGINTIQDA